MKKQSQPSSFLQDQQESKQTKIQKQSNQFKALFLKNLRLQSKQIGTNICQILTPIICLIFTYLIKTIAQDGLKVNIDTEDNMYPYMFNNYTDYDRLNYDPIKKVPGPVRDGPLQYYLFECAPETCDKQFLGYNHGTKGPYAKSGMLGNVPYNLPSVTYCPNFYQNETHYEIKSVPFFIQSSINEQLYKRLNVIGDQSFSKIKNGSGLHYLPDGSFKFNHLNGSGFQVEVKVDDCRDLQYHRINGISKNKEIRFFNDHQYNFTQAQFTQAYGLLNVIHVATSSFIKTVADATVGAGFLLMPAASQGSFVDTLINSISALIYPLGLSLLFPVFLYSVVLEKEQRLVQMMKMNGLKIRYYWLTFFVFNLVLCIITNIIFYLLGSLVLSYSFFTKTSKLLIFIVSLGWSLSQIGMAAFFQTFLNKSRSANIIGYLFSIWTTMIGATLNLGSYQYPSQLPTSLQIIPPFAFVRIFYLMMMKCSNGDCYYDMGLLNQQIKSCIVYLYVGFIVFFLLGIYLFQVIPQQFGVRRSPLFPFHSLVKLFKRKRQIQINTSQDPELRNYISQHEEDDFSKKQRQRVISFGSQQEQDQIKNEYPLIINNMRKLYKKQGILGFYPAVRSFNLAIAKKQTFGLLGPNGAGKTTLISMITGMYQPNYGNAWIGGYDIQTSIQKAQLQMGVCPQFDLVWPQLSVQQHLYFYARLKGIPEKKIKAQVQQSIKEVKLQKFANFAASELSGGMRRRLSVAISLVGDPRIVFLDEPSTGLDPQNRRQLWAVLAGCQAKRALFITTHMMQEADTLCNRIGIITSGVLRTIQTPIKLKKTYGQGYDVVINTIKQQRQLISRESLHLGIQQQQWFNQQARVRQSIGSFVQHQISKTYQLNKVSRKIVEFMKKQFPGTYLFKHFNGYLILKVPSTFKISTLFQTMNAVEKQLGFSDIAITNSSLEDVFMKVVEKFDSEEKNFYPYNSEEIEDNDDNNSGQNSGQNQQPEEPNEQHQNQPINMSEQKFKSFGQNRIEQKPEVKVGEPHFDSVISKQRESVLSNHEESNSNKPQQSKSNRKSSSSYQDNQNNNKNDSQPKQSFKRSGKSSDDYF